MISPLEIGFALSAALLVIGYVSTLPKPRAVRIRAREVRSERHPKA